MCLVFCILYSISCLTKLSSNFNWLLLGRLTGGVSTSLLFSVFEAWMVSEHNSRGFKSDLLSSTFSWATFLNGMVAIGSGVVAEYVVGRYGNVAPFMTAIGFLMTAFCVVFLTWKENYGSEGNTESSVMGLKRAAKIVVNGEWFILLINLRCEKLTKAILQIRISYHAVSFNPFSNQQCTHSSSSTPQFSNQPQNNSQAHNKPIYHMALYSLHSWSPS